VVTNLNKRFFCTGFIGSGLVFPAKTKLDVASVVRRMSWCCIVDDSNMTMYNMTMQTYVKQVRPILVLID
jgi:hypothetical protein